MTRTPRPKRPTTVVRVGTRVAWVYSDRPGAVVDALEALGLRVATCAVTGAITTTPEHVPDLIAWLEYHHGQPVTVRRRRKVA